MTQGYLIYLPEYDNSVAMANRALQSADKHGWRIKLYPGVNGHVDTLSNHNLRIYSGSKKAIRLMERPGTAGCFLSQYMLWQQCFVSQTPMCIFEHDVIFKKPMGQTEMCDVYKFEGFKKAKPIPPGIWYEGARAYLLQPSGAKKMLDWVHSNGAMPADWMLCDGIVDMKFDLNNKVGFKSDKMSFTKDL
jgi:GR25 family glycosyltransferase involved in LPS biosynthesis